MRVGGRQIGISDWSLHLERDHHVLVCLRHEPEKGLVDRVAGWRLTLLTLSVAVYRSTWVGDTPEYAEAKARGWRS